MPFFVIRGVLALIVGFAILRLAVLQARASPRWAAVPLVVGSQTMLGFNDQSVQAYIAIPNGVAWTAVGYLL